jgi:hypothetical protein
VYPVVTTNYFSSVSASGSFATGAVYPTMLARHGGAASYVLASHLDALQAMPPPTVRFALLKAEL